MKYGALLRNSCVVKNQLNSILIETPGFWRVIILTAAVVLARVRVV
jgi:hypothetical protein